MDLQSGFPLFLQQFRALFTKNFILAIRKKKATLVQIFSPFFFFLLWFLLQKIIDDGLGELPVAEVRHPKLLIAPPIPPCEDKFFIKPQCFDFVWSGEGIGTIDEIVKGIMANNPGRQIPPSKVKSFRTKQEVDTWLFQNPMRCAGALHFAVKNATVISYGIQTNTTHIKKRWQYEDPTFKFQIPFQLAAEREIARFLTRDPTFSWTVQLKEFPHPSIDVKKESYSGVFFGLILLFSIPMYGFITQINSLVQERELKLRQAMTMVGLYESAYWLSWLAWEGVLVLLMSLLTVLLGMAFRFDFFLKNSFFVVFLLFFLFQLCLVGFAFMLSAFISKSSSTSTVGIAVYFLGLIIAFATFAGFPYDSPKFKSYRTPWTFLPPTTFSYALNILMERTINANGSNWSDRAECPEELNCALTINDSYKWLACTFFLWFALAIYLDNIIPRSGVRKSLFYFLKPGYWTGKGGNKMEEGSFFCCKRSLPPPDHNIPDNEDVLEEEETVKQQSTEGVIDQNVAVQIRSLVKTFPRSKKSKSPFHAVKGLSVNFHKDQLFCLLGPNGAGKTTVINCLTGITSVTDGDALVCGHSIRSSIGMTNIRKIIGVCPQFDILWDALSGEEHLHLFASIKGLPPAAIKSVAQKSLSEVRLTEAAKKRSGDYSGGMRRRLSVAIALLGDPKLVILDEPTTGMDPITRRHVWDIINCAKKGRAIVLTTHLMEEADILSDRIGIMAKGKLRCIGNSIRLKSRFGSGFIVNVSFIQSTDGQNPFHDNEVSTTHHEAVKQFFKYHLNVVPEEQNNSVLTFAIPREREGQLTRFFELLENRRGEFGIADFQLSLTTLEEVFLNIARQAEVELASAEGRTATVTLSSGQSIKIPVGTRYVRIPETNSEENPRGNMVEVYWEPDDSGTLSISGLSDEIPIPPDVQVFDSV